MRPPVSVIITTYNGASRGFLAQAIQSVMSQTFRDYELVIVDDGSTDGTREECKRYLVDPRVRYIHQENRGLAGARNRGIGASSGKYICFLDDDDVWRRDKLEKQLEFIQLELKNLGQWGLVFTWIELIDAAGKIIGYRGHHQKGSIHSSLFYGNTIDAPSSVMVKREVFEKVGLFDEFFRKCQDWDMWLRISKEYLIFPLKEYLVKYREHQNSISAKNEEVFFYEQAVLKKALANAPQDIIPRKAYASCYLNRSVGFFACDDFGQFRQLFLAGAKLSPRAMRLEHIFLFPLSFVGKKPVHLLKGIKRAVFKMLMGLKQRRVSQQI